MAHEVGHIQHGMCLCCCNLCFGSGLQCICPDCGCREARDAVHPDPELAHALLDNKAAIERVVGLADVPPPPPVVRAEQPENVVSVRPTTGNVSPIISLQFPAATRRLPGEEDQ